MTHFKDGFDFIIVASGSIENTEFVFIFLRNPRKP